MPELNKSQAIRNCFAANPKAKNQEVIDTLARQGITVTTGLVRTIKFKHNKRQAARKAARSPAAVADKKPELSKTQAVRNYLKAHKKATNKEVVEALAKDGITISTNYVGNIKSTKNKRRRAVRSVVAESGIGIPEVKAARRTSRP